MDGYEPESNARKYAIIGAVAGVILLIVGAGVFVIVKRRQADTSAQTAQTANVSVNGAPSSAAQAPEYPGPLPPPVAAGPTDAQGVPATAVTPGGQSAGFDPSTDRLLTDEEKAQLDYPKEWRVRLRAMQKYGVVFPVYTVEDASVPRPASVPAQPKNWHP